MLSDNFSRVRLVDVSLENYADVRQKVLYEDEGIGEILCHWFLRRGTRMVLSERNDCKERAAAQLAL